MQFWLNGCVTFYTLCASNNHRDIKIENKTTTNYDILNNSYP